MKKVISLLLISLMLSLTIKWDCIQGKSLTVDDRAVSAFRLAKSDIFSSTFSSWGKLEKVYNQTEMESAAKRVAHFLTIQQKSMELSKNFSDSLSQVMIKGEDLDGSVVTIKMDSILNDNKISESHLIIDVFHDGEFNMEHIGSKLKELYSSYNSAPYFNTCVIGTINGKVSEEGTCKLEKDTLKCMGTNVNFDMRYNSRENKTYMWIASPIITTEY